MLPAGFSLFPEIDFHHHGTETILSGSGTGPSKLAGLSSAAWAEPAVCLLSLLVVLLQVELVLYFCLSCGPEIRNFASLSHIMELTKFQVSSPPSRSLHVS